MRRLASSLLSLLTPLCAAPGTEARQMRVPGRARSWRVQTARPAAPSPPHCVFVLVAERRAAIVEPEPRLGRHHGSVSQAPGSGLPRRCHAAFPQDAVRSPAERDAADAAQVLLSLPALRLPGAGHELLATVLTRSVQEARSAVSQGGCPGGCWEFGMMFRRRSLGELASFFFHGSQSWLVFET